MIATVYKFYNGWYDTIDDESTRRAVLDTACRFHGAEYVIRKINKQMMLNFITIADIAYISKVHVDKYPKKYGSVRIDPLKLT
jgi:hypothetical protein